MDKKIDLIKSCIHKQEMILYKTRLITEGIDEFQFFKDYNKACQLFTIIKNEYYCNINNEEEKLTLLISMKEHMIMIDSYINHINIKKDIIKLKKEIEAILLSI